MVPKHIIKNKMRPCDRHLLSADVNTHTRSERGPCMCSVSNVTSALSVQQLQSPTDSINYQNRTWRSPQSPRHLAELLLTLLTTVFLPADPLLRLGCLYIERPTLWAIPWHLATRYQKWWEYHALRTSIYKQASLSWVYIGGHQFTEERFKDGTSKHYEVLSSWVVYMLTNFLEGTTSLEDQHDCLHHRRYLRNKRLQME